MKAFFIIILIGIKTVSFAQDKIIMMDGTELNVKVIEIDPVNIKYKKSELLEGPLYTVLKTDIFKIAYQNGVNELIYNASVKSVSNTMDGSVYNINNDPQSFFRGRADAKENYSSSGTTVGAVITGTLGGLFVPVGAVVLPICYGSIIVGSEVKLTKLIKDPVLLNNSSYVAGYQEEVKKKKRRNLYLGGGISFSLAATFAASFLLINSQL